MNQLFAGDLGIYLPAVYHNISFDYSKTQLKN